MGKSVSPFDMYSKNSTLIKCILCCCINVVVIVVRRCQGYIFWGLMLTRLNRKDDTCGTLLAYDTPTHYCYNNFFFKRSHRFRPSGVLVVVLGLALCKLTLWKNVHVYFFFFCFFGKVYHVYNTFWQHCSY